MVLASQYLRSTGSDSSSSSVKYQFARKVGLCAQVGRHVEPTGHNVLGGGGGSSYEDDFVQQDVALALSQQLAIPLQLAADYPEFYRTLAREVAVRPHIPTHPRIFIWGPFESRLLQPDIVVLGSLNEGTWPEAADPGPWLNRTMRRDLGLPAPEQQIGYAAHDFSQLLGAETVYLTRSQMIEGDPTVPSRWLLRLDAVLARLGISDCLESEQPWLAWAQNRDRIDAPHRISRPEPRPPLELRPRRLSVSSIETWIANPYALFAERILKLDALAPLGGEPAARLRGSVVHEALGQFAQKFPVELPDDPTREMLAIAHEVFAALRAHPRVAAFWLPRFQRFASWFGQMEKLYPPFF